MTTDDEELRLYTAAQVAELWGISKSWLQKAAAADEIPSTYIIRPGRTKGLLRFDRTQVEEIRSMFTARRGSNSRRQLARTA